MNIAVIFGGNSVEHEVSIISALQAIENFPKEYNVIPVYLTKKMEMYISEDFKNINIFKESLAVEEKYGKFNLYKEDNKVYFKEEKAQLFKKKRIYEVEVFFPIVHGTNVEDGKLQGYLSFFDIPIVGPSTLSGAIGQDKAVAKDLLKSEAISQTNYLWLTDNNKLSYYVDTIMEKIGVPLIIKPANLGSSVGINVVHKEEDILKYLEMSFKYDSKVVVEELIENFEEMNISVRGNYLNYEVSVIEKVVKSADILSYEDKYLGDGKGKNSNSEGMASLSREIPAKITTELTEKIENIALEVARTLYVRGIIRIDLLVVGEDVYVNEVNNIPGSLAFYLWEKKGVSYSQLLKDTIEMSIDEYFQEKKKETSFKTNILSLANEGIKK